MRKKVRSTAFYDSHIDAVISALASDRTFDISNSSMVVCTHLVLKSMGITVDAKRRELIAQISNGSKAKEIVSRRNAQVFVGVIKELIEQFDNEIKRIAKKGSVVNTPFLAITRETGDFVIPLVYGDITEPGHLKANLASTFHIDFGSIIKKVQKAATADADAPVDPIEQPASSSAADKGKRLEVSKFISDLLATCIKETYNGITCKNFSEINANIRHSDELGKQLVDQLSSGECQLIQAAKLSGYLSKVLDIVEKNINDNPDYVKSLPRLVSYFT